MLNDYSKCKKCNHTNPVYKHICEKCRSYLRERVVNIDLWKTIQLIIEDPNKAFTQIIFSEHKNFTLFLTLFIAIKNLVIARFLSVPTLGLDGVTTPLIVSFIFSILLSLLITSGISWLQLLFYKGRKLIFRFKDIYAVNTYALIPFLFGLFFIFPVELIVLGGDIFSNNPYSYQIKPALSYILMTIEVIMIIWSFILMYKSILILGIKRTQSALLIILLFILWFSSLYLASKVLFTII